MTVDPTLIKETVVELSGRSVVVRFVRNRRARRLILRIDDRGEGENGVVVTLPGGATKTEGLVLVYDKADWVLKMLEKLLPRIPFADGEVVPLSGVDHRIRAVPEGRGAVRHDGPEIMVSGRPEHLARRLRDWFRGQARTAIQPLVHQKAGELGRRPGRITIRDTKSRWGSCSHDGNLSFCWRLVMASAQVLDYVVADEVAHLVEHSHSAKYWQAVARLTGDVDEPRERLRLNGEKLHRYG